MNAIGRAKTQRMRERPQEEPTDGDFLMAERIAQAILVDNSQMAP
jgi:hypothetical protein